MKKTLTQLRERNTNFRSSFARADMNGVQAQELKLLEDKAQSAEEALVKVRGELSIIKQCQVDDTNELEKVVQQLETHESDIMLLAKNKSALSADVGKAKEQLDEYSKQISCESVNDESVSSRRADLQNRAYHADIIELQANKLKGLLLNLADEFPELAEDIHTDFKKMGI